MADSIHSHIEQRAQWNEALIRFAQAEAACRTYDRNVWRPAYEREDAFEMQRGLIAPGCGRDATPGYFEKVKALRAAHPEYMTPAHVTTEMERLSEAVVEAESALMNLEAPDPAALRWKLDRILEIEHNSDDDVGSTPSWDARYVHQTIEDYRRLLPEVA